MVGWVGGRQGDGRRQGRREVGDDGGRGREKERTL